MPTGLELLQLILTKFMLTTNAKHDSSTQRCILE
jgi:hypothetical protein